MQLLANKTFYAGLLAAAVLLVPLATLTAQQTDRASVTVILRDRATGTPLAGEVGLALQTAQGVVLKHAQANEFGEAVLNELPAGATHLSTKQDGYAVEHAAFSLATGEAQHVELRLSPAVRVRGFVRDPNGAPLAGVQIKAVYEQSRAAFANSYQWETGDARSDEQGYFEVAVHPERAFVLIASRQGWLSDFTPPLRAAVATPIQLQLSHGIRVTGEVRDSAGNPLAGAQVQLADVEERRLAERFLPFELLQQRQQFTVTDVAGSFEFRGVRPARKALVVTHPQFAPRQQTLEVGARLQQFETRVILQN